MSDRRRVLIYTSGVLPTSETFVLDQARSLRRWTPTLVGRYLVPDGLDVKELLAPEMRERAARRGGLHEVAQRLHRRIPVLRSVVDRVRPQLIHAHFLTGGFDVLASLRPLPCPVVVTAHGFDATWYGSPPQTMRPEQWLHSLFRRRLLRSDVNFIAVSHFIRDELIRLGAEEDCVAVHHTGVDTEYFTPPVGGGERRGLLFVGRLVEKKGVLDLLRAVTTLKQSGTDVPVEIIGDGPLRPVVERFIREHDLDAHVRGSQSRNAVRDAMRRSALLCSPSRTASTGDREGFGMVLAEAQATGLPVIATRCGGMVDAVVDGRTGLLVQEANVQELAEAIGTILRDDGLRGRLGASARLWVVDNFSLQRQNAALEAIYDEWGAPVIDVDVIIPLHRADRPIFETVASTTAEVQGVATRAIVVLHNLEPGPAMREALARVATVLTVADGIPSPSGPRNAGLESATAPYVFFLDSDDVLAPNCLAQLHSVAEASGADVVLPSVQDGQRFLGTPLAFRRSTTQLDVVRHHLFTRSHVPALLRRSTLVEAGVRYPEGVRTGQDFVMMAELYAKGTIAMAFDAVYVMVDDGGERVSQTPLPPDLQLAAVRAIATSPWARALPHEQRVALAQRILSINLAGGWRRKRDMGHPLSSKTHGEMRALVCDLGPGARDLLSVRDRTSLRFNPRPGRLEELLMSKPFGFVPTSWRGILSPLGPVSVQLRSSIVRRRRRR